MGNNSMIIDKLTMLKVFIVTIAKKTMLSTMVGTGVLLLVSAAVAVAMDASGSMYPEDYLTCVVFIWIGAVFNQLMHKDQ